MPTYKLTDPNTGKVIRVTGDSPPTQEEVAQIFGDISPITQRARIPTALAGPVGFGSVEGSEDVLPSAGQTAGAPFGPVASVAGATGGQALRQGVRALRGKSVENPLGRNVAFAGPIGIKGPIAEEVARTATLEGVLRAPGAIFFRKQIGGKLRQEAGKKVGKLIKKVKEKSPLAGISKNDIIKNIDEALKKNVFERGGQRAGLVTLKRKLENLKRGLTFEEAVQVERQLGSEAQFAKTSTGGVFAKTPKTPGLNKASKKIRSKVSGKVDEAASKAGVPEFKGASKKFSELAKKFPEEELQKRSVPLTRTLLTTAAGAGGTFGPVAVGGSINPLVGVMAALSLVPQSLRTAFFRNVLDKPASAVLGKGLTLGSAEIARRLGNRE